VSVGKFTPKEVRFRNLYKAGQRDVTDKKRKWLREKIRPYNEKTFNQLELTLVTVPDQDKWLEDKLNNNKTTNGSTVR